MSSGSPVSGKVQDTINGTQQSPVGRELSAYRVVVIDWRSVVTSFDDQLPNTRISSPKVYA